VAYRSEGHLVGCLDAIAADRPECSQIIVVDNASPDASARVAEQHPSRPRIVRSGENLGFGRGCNLGVEAVDCDYVLFVNPDARLHAGASAELLAVFADETVAATGAQIIGARGELKAASAGFEPSIRSAIGHFLLLGRLPYLGSVFPPFQLPFGRAEGAVDWIGGASMMVRTEAFRAVGGFDPSIFLYSEDFDLCRRLREEGWRIWYRPSAVVEHDIGGSQGSDQPSRWWVALHEYVGRQQGYGRARIVSVIAAVGLGMRALALTPRSTGRARLLATAAATALLCAVTPSRRHAVR
jgi:GT2 family glycosyltransferase